MRSVYTATTLLMVVLEIFGCQKSGEVVAEAGGEKVYLQEVDQLISNSLHEYLSAIYDARSIAADELINLKLLQLEAKNRNISIDTLLTREEEKLSKDITLELYIKNNGLQGGVIDEENPVSLFPLNSTEGRKILEESYKKYLKVQFVENPRKKYSVKLLLRWPESPMIDLSGIKVHTQGNINSKNSIVIITDFNCPVCRRKAPALKELYERNKDFFRFDFVSLSPSINLPIRLAECAATQGKFWESYNLLFNMNIADTSDIGKLSRKLGLDSSCLSCLQSDKIHSEITNNLKRLRALGITSTPTVIVNNQIYYGSLTHESIRRFMLAQ